MSREIPNRRGLSVARRPTPTGERLPHGPSARALASDALRRVDEGAYANLVVNELLSGCGLDDRDRAFVTELVHGTTRMRRALDFQIDRFVRGPLDDETRRVLRLGAYQLLILRTRAHAAVDSTVRVAPHRSRGLVNAVLRKIADAGEAPWPDDATRLSYPDWIVDQLTADLGADTARATLRHMNSGKERTDRADGYAQDRASQWVAQHVGARSGELVLDLCSAPGGKATEISHTGATVIANDIRPHRIELVAQNVRRLGLSGRVIPVLADGANVPFPPATFDRVLVDAPCTGLGVLHRRPDARWRVMPEDIDALVALQRQLLSTAIDLLRPGGTLVYSVCTLTDAETVGNDRWMAAVHPALTATSPPPSPWMAHGRGARLLPQTTDTDGMSVFSYRAE